MRWPAADVLILVGKSDRQFDDRERCLLRPGNAHSAEGWREVLLPVGTRSRGQSALHLPGAELEQAAPRRRQARVALAELYPRVGFILTNLKRPAERISKFYNARHRRAVHVWTPPALQVHSLVVRHEQVSCCNVFGLWCGHLAAGLDEIRGQLPIIKASSKLFTALGFCRPRSDRSCHRLKEHHRSSWKQPALARHWGPSTHSFAGCNSFRSSVKQAHDRSHRG